MCVGSVLMKMIVIQFTFQDEESGMGVRGLGFSGTLTLNRRRETPPEYSRLFCVKQDEGV